MLHRVALVRTDVLEERIASIISVTRIGKLGTLAVANNRSTLRRNLTRWFLSPWLWRRYIPPKRRFSQEPHIVTSKRTEFFSHCRENLKSYKEEFAYNGIPVTSTGSLMLWSWVNDKKEQTPWPLVRKRTIPTERPPLVGILKDQTWMRLFPIVFPFNTRPTD
jgi:hypothetical protein